jgi:hypothetical protein
MSGFSNLKLESFSDRELLHIVDDLGGAKDWVPITSIATRVGLVRGALSEEQYLIHARRCVSVRLSWIRRLSDTLVRNAERPKIPEWMLSKTGIAVVNVSVAPTFTKQLENMDEMAAVVALDSLSRRYQTTTREAANLMRRQWVYGAHPNRRS